MARKEGLQEQEIRRLILDIAMFRDLKEDIESFLNESERISLVEKFRDLESRALNLLLREREIQSGTARLKVVVIGDFSAGKSSFINSVLGKSICPVDACPTTSSITRITYGDKAKIVRLDTGAGVSQREYEKLVRHPVKGKPRDTVQRFEYNFQSDFLRNMVLVDTPGFANPKNPRDAMLTEEETRDADVVFFVIDIQKGGIAADILKTVKNLRKNVSDTEWWLILNKADLKNNKGRNRIYENIQKEHGKTFKSIFLYSSLIKTEDPLRMFITEFDNLKQKIRQSVYNQTPINSNIKGVDDELGYRLSIDGITIKFPERIDADISNRNDLYSYLENLSIRKNELLSASIGRDTNIWQNRRFHTLQDVQSDINILFGKLSAKPGDDIIEIRLSDLKKEIELELNTLLSYIVNNAYFPKSTKEKGTFWDSTVYIVSYKNTDTYSNYYNSPVWDNIISGIDGFCDDFEKDYSVELDKKKVIRDVSNVKNSIYKNMNEKLAYFRLQDNYNDLNTATIAMQEQINSGMVKHILAEIAENGAYNIIGRLENALLLDIGKMKEKERSDKGKYYHVNERIEKAMNNVEEVN